MSALDDEFRTGNRRLRWIIYVHLTAVMITVSIVRTDGGVFDILFAPALWAFVLCPFYFLVAIIVSSVRRGAAVRAFVAEALTTFAHIYAMLPMVQ